MAPRMMMLGACYFPMAMMAVVVLGSLSALSPHVVLPAIARSGALYWLAVFVIILLFMFTSLSADLLAAIPLVRSLIGALVSMIALMINGRTLGIIYREKQEELGWI